MVWQSWKKAFQYQDVTAITGTKEIGFIVYNNETYWNNQIRGTKRRNETLPLFTKFYCDFMASHF